MACAVQRRRFPVGESPHPDTSMLRIGGSPTAITILSARYRPLGSSFRTAGWSATTSCFDPDIGAAETNSAQSWRPNLISPEMLRRHGDGFISTPRRTRNKERYKSVDYDIQ